MPVGGELVTSAYSYIFPDVLADASAIVPSSKTEADLGDSLLRAGHVGG